MEKDSVGVRLPKYFIVIYRGNWADEFDLQEMSLRSALTKEEAWQGFKVEYVCQYYLLGGEGIRSLLEDEDVEKMKGRSDEEVAEYLADIEGISFNSIYFGTNEWVDEPHEDEFEIQEITKLEYDIIKRYLGNRFGVGIIPH